MKKIVFVLAAILFATFSFAQNNWHLSNTGIRLHDRCTDFATAPNGDVYLVTSSADTGGVVCPRLYKSINAGNSWTEISMGIPTFGVVPVAIAFKENILVLACYDFIVKRVYISTDGGITWTEKGHPAIGGGYAMSDLAVAPNGDLYLAANPTVSATGCATVIFKSADTGITWLHVIPSGLPDLAPRSLIFVNDKMVMTVRDASGNKRIYTSTDYGNNWTFANLSTSPPQSLSSLVYTPNNDLYAAGTMLSGSVYLPTLHKSSDQGSSWEDVTPVIGMFPTYDYNCFAYAGNTLLIGTDSSVYSSDLPPLSLGENIARGIHVFPSPFHDQLTIFTPTLSPHTICLTNCVGQIVKHRVLLPDETMLDTTELPAGVYFLTISGSNSRETFKVVKQ